MGLTFYLKPFIDMIYQLQILDVGLMLICIYCIFSSRYQPAYDKIDLIVFSLMLLFFFSFLRNLEGWSQFLKIESSFMLYFLGRYYQIDHEQVILCIRKGFIPVLVFTILSFITGWGFIEWGTVNTFRGFYYFKTDLALAMTQCFIVYAFCKHNTKIESAIPFLCLYFILIANARIYYMIIAFSLFLLFCYWYEQKTGKALRISSKFAIYSLIIGVIAIIAMISLNDVLGEEYLLLDDSDDLYSGENTQGRALAWAEIYDIFDEKSLLTKFIGIDLCSDISPTLDIDSHNNYLKILFSTGYIGSAIFIIFIAIVISFICKIKDREQFYITLSIFATYIIGGLSYITIESTQGTWLPMFIVGSVISANQHTKTLTVVPDCTYNGEE